MQRALETLALFVLIGLTAVRPLVPETYDSAGSALTQALGELSDPTPLRTLVFDLLILGAVTGWLLARAVGSARSYRRTGLEWGACLVALAALVSCLVAGQKRLAINASIDWLCYPLLSIALVQLASKEWHRRMLLAAVLASACAGAVHCFDQYTGFEDTWAQYQTDRADFWARQGVELDSPKVELFERRILAREASGFLPHSNVAGSYLVLCGFAALGVLLVLWRAARVRVPCPSPPQASAGMSEGATRRMAALRLAMAPDHLPGQCLAGACAALAILMFAAAALTKSVGALVSGVAGVALWVLVGALRNRIASHRRRVLVIGWCVAAGAGLAVVGHGLYRGSLPGQSLNFRWAYWRASAGLIADHPLTGIGRENFGRHYLKYKSIESPEEVANPHNLFVQAAADWGIPGLLGVMLMLAGASVAITRAPPEHSSPRPRGRDGGYRGSWPLWLATLGALVVFGRLPLLGSSDANYLYVAAVMAGVPWLLAFACFAATRRNAADAAAVPRGHEAVVSTAVAIGLFTFVLHEMINFAVFVPAAATTCFALLAYCVAARAPCEVAARPLTRLARWLPPVVSAGVTVALAIMVVGPVARAAHHVRLAREAADDVGPAWRASLLVQPVEAVAHHLRRAAAADPLDPTPHALRGEWLLAVSSAPVLTTSTQRVETLEFAAESLERAIELDPVSVGHRRRLMQIFRAKARQTGRPADYNAAIEAAREALRLYPRHPSGWIALGDRLFEAGEAAQSPGRFRAAIEAYEHALQLDDARPAWEKIRRLRANERVRIDARITRARRATEKSPD